MNDTIFVLTVAAASALAYAALQRIDIGFAPPPTKAQRNTATLIAACVGAVLAVIVLAAL